MHLALVALLSLATAPQPVRLAVHPLASRGAAPEAMQQLEAALRIELSRIPGVRVSDERTLRAAWRGDCGAAPSCLAALGRAVDAQEVLFGEVQAMPDSYAVTLRLFDVGLGRETAATTASVNRDVEEMVQATRAQVAQLKAPARYAGRLLLLLSPGDQAWIDGRAADAEPRVMRPGTYAVRLARAGRVLETWVEVRFELTAVVGAAGGGALVTRYEAWEPPARVEFWASADGAESGASADRASPAWSRWAGWLATGTGLGLLAGGGIQHWRAFAQQRELDRLRGPDGSFPQHRSGEVYDRMDRVGALRTSGWVLAGIGAAAAGAGAGLLLLAGPAEGGAQLTARGTF